jgi:hypothetical protein
LIHQSLFSFVYDMLRYPRMTLGVISSQLLVRNAFSVMYNPDPSQQPFSRSILVLNPDAARCLAIIIIM